MIKRIFDIVFSISGLILLSPVLIVIAILIRFDSKGPVLYKQTRVGRNNKDFKLLKFRTMNSDSDSKGLLTVGGRDPRITRQGIILENSNLMNFRNF